MNITQLETKRRAAQRQIEQLQAPQRAIAAAEAELTALEQQIEAERAAAVRQATMARLVELASAGAAALADIQQAQEAFDQAIAPLLASYTAARKRQAETRRAFYGALAEIAPEARRKYSDQAVPSAILVELEAAGADLAGVLANFAAHGDLPLDRRITSTHQYPGALATGLRESFVHQGGHLPLNK